MGVYDPSDKALTYKLWFADGDGFADWFSEDAVDSEMRCSEARGSYPSIGDEVRATVERQCGDVAMWLFLDECWLSVMSSFSPRELCTCAALSSRCRRLSNSDVLWRRHCRDRWADKQFMPDTLFRNGDYSHANISLDEAQSH